MKEFKTYHPIVNLIYFVFVIGFSCVFMHPAALAISLFCGFSYSAVLKGRASALKSLLYLVPMLVASALVNPVFNHRGATILYYLPSGNPITLESIVYGICAGVMIVSVICHFSCYNEIMTSDKFIYLFGKIIPAMSLIISMTLRLVPTLASQLKVVTNARRCMGRSVSGGGIIRRARSGLAILSVMTTWSLENSIETADSMKARGYGLPGRTTFSIFRFDTRDKKALACIVVLGLCTLGGAQAGGMRFEYFPLMSFDGLSPLGIFSFASYFALCMCPVIIEIMEVRRWKKSVSKI